MYSDKLQNITLAQSSLPTASQKKINLRIGIVRIGILCKEVDKMLGELLKKILQLYVDRQVTIIEDDKREALARLLEVEGVKFKFGSDPRIIMLEW
jgi:hypothetical protein